ncbi:hypothetical protein GUJ93_ZPchr0013g36981 [Zizania palustris]|uniref:Uncharacterized protein n=1 Tax=Zizania palustris TaxID=103762 RepID=A0A8J6BW23_ZIZPA|nr:hypothetical protein GUJ93_ZPchr0013g36981 [Zizania palustris]
MTTTTAGEPGPEAARRRAGCGRKSGQEVRHSGAVGCSGVQRTDVGTTTDTAPQAPPLHRLQAPAPRTANPVADENRRGGGLIK